MASPAQTSQASAVTSQNAGPRGTAPSPFPEFELSLHRNFGTIAHVDGGKTSLTELLLQLTGQKHKRSTIEDGKTTTDHLAIERERGITVNSAAVNAGWNDHTLTMIDTPGHIDFTAEVQRCLRVLDGAVLVIDGKKGVEAQTRTVFRQAQENGIPVVFFINKLDLEGASVEGSLKSLIERLGIDPLLVQHVDQTGTTINSITDLLTGAFYERDGINGGETHPTGLSLESLEPTLVDARAGLVDRICTLDETLFEQMMETEKTPSPEDLIAGLRRICLSRQAYPVFVGSAKTGQGGHALLDGITRFLPSPLDRPEPVATSVTSDDKVQIAVGADQPLSAYAFKSTSTQSGDTHYVRVYAGTIDKGAELFNPRTGKEIRASQIVAIQGGENVQVQSVEAGQVAGITGKLDLRTGDTLCLKGDPHRYESIEFPEPVVTRSIRPKDRAEAAKLSEALHRIARNDPSFHFHTDEETGQALVSGMGQLHLGIIAYYITEDLGIKVRFGNPRVAYRLTIGKDTLVKESNKKQTGGKGSFAVVEATFGPGEEDGLQFSHEITGGRLSPDFIDAFETGVRRAMEREYHTGVPVDAIRVCLHDGQYHPKDSSIKDFQRAGELALGKALWGDNRNGEAVFLEPYMLATVDTPFEYTGDVMGLLQGMRGENLNVIGGESEQLITGEVPLSLTFEIDNQLRDITSGLASHTLEFMDRRLAVAQPGDIYHHLKQLNKKSGK